MRAKTDRADAAAQFRKSLQDQRAKLEAALVEKSSLSTEIGILNEQVRVLRGRVCGARVN